MRSEGKLFSKKIGLLVLSLLLLEPAGGMEQVEQRNRQMVGRQDGRGAAAGCATGTRSRGAMKSHCKPKPINRTTAHLHPQNQTRILLPPPHYPHRPLLHPPPLPRHESQSAPTRAGRWAALWASWQASAVAAESNQGAPSGPALSGAAVAVPCMESTKLLRWLEGRLERDPLSSDA